MRILQVIPFFSPRMGGSPQVVYQISLHLARRGHEVTLLSSDFGVREACFPEGPFQVRLFPNIFARWGFYFNPSLFFWLRDHISEFDIIHLHEYRTYQNIVAHHLAVKNEIPYVFAAHGTVLVIAQHQLAKRIYDLMFGNRILADAKQFIAVSPFEVEQYQQQGIEEDRISLIFNGINLEDFDKLPPPGIFRRKYRIPSETKIALYLGRLNQTKGIRFLIETYAKYVSKREKSILIVVGPNDGEQTELCKLTFELGLQEQVRFVGPIYGDEKLSGYVDADILILPAQYEIFGLVLFEALMCGTPIIATEECGMSEVIKKHRIGWIVPYGDKAALFQALTEGLSVKNKSIEMVMRGQDFIQSQMDWNCICSKVERLYRNEIDS